MKKETIIRRTNSTKYQVIINRKKVAVFSSAKEAIKYSLS